MAQIKKLQKGATIPSATPVTPVTPTSTPTPDTNITYKGVNFDKAALINGYKDYLKTTAQNNVTGFEQADQYKDIDEHLNNRINSLQDTSVIGSNPDFTTAPVKINGITGLNKFLDSGDKSISKQFENEAFYNYLDKSVELNQQTSTPTATKDYHRFHSLIGNITNSDYDNKTEGFNTGWSNPAYTYDQRKVRVKQAMIDELTGLRDAGNKDIVGLDPDVVAKLRSGDADKYINAIPGANDQQLAEIAGHLGLNTELANLLPTPAVVTTPTPTAAVPTVAPAVIPVVSKKLPIILKNPPKVLPKTPVTTGSGTSVLGDITDPSKWTTAGVLDASATAADVASLAGGPVGVGAGLLATGLQAGADITRGVGGWDIAKNIGINLGFTALALIPGIGGEAKVAYRSAKAVETALEVAKAANGVDKVLEGVNAAKAVIKASETVGEAAIDATKLAQAKKVLATADAVTEATNTAKKLVISTLKGSGTGRIAPAITKVLVNSPHINQAVTIGKQLLVGNAIVQGVSAVGQTVQDIHQGGVGNISLNDIRGVAGGIGGVRAMGSMMSGMSTKPSTVIENPGEVGEKINLTNLPEGYIDNEIKVPIGTKDYKTAINTDFDNKIQVKQTALDELNKTPSSPENEISDNAQKTQLTNDIALLNKAKTSATIDKGGVKGFINRTTGQNNIKPIIEKGNVVDENKSAFVPKWLQQHALKRITENPINVTAENITNAQNQHLLELQKFRDMKTTPVVTPEPIPVIPVTSETSGVIQSTINRNPFVNTEKMVNKLPNKQIQAKNKINALNALTRFKKTGSMKSIEVKKQGGLIPMFQNPTGPIQFLQTPTSGAPWEASVHKNDPLRSNPNNWIKRSSSLIYDYKEPSTLAFKTLPNNNLGDVSITAPKLVTTPTNVISNGSTTFYKTPNVVSKPTTLNLPDLTEYIRAANSINTNNQMTRNATASVNPILKTAVQGTGVDKNWLPIEAQANQQAVNTQRLASRPMSSDASLQTASNLEGATKANDIRTTGAEKVWGVQEENKQNANLLANKNAELRSATANENLQSIGASRQLLTSLQNQNAFTNTNTVNNLLTGLSKERINRNIVKNQYDVARQKQGLINKYNATTKPLQDQFDQIYGDEGENIVNAPEYKTWQANMRGLSPGNSEYYAWDSSKNSVLREQYNNKITELNRNLANTRKAALNTYNMNTQGINTEFDPSSITINRPSWLPTTLGNTSAKYASGGSMTPGEKYSLNMQKLNAKNQKLADKTYQKETDTTTKQNAKISAISSKQQAKLLNTVLGKK